MTSNSNKELRLRRPKEEVRAKLQAQIEEGERIIKYPTSNEEELKSAKEALKSWYDYTRDLLLVLFSTDKMQHEFVWSVGSFGVYLTFEQKIEEHRQHLDKYLNTLRSIIKRIDLFEEDTDTVKSTLAAETESISKKTVFVVHGRDESLRRSMFDFLRALGLDPLEWSQAILATNKASPYIGDVLDTAFRLAQAIIVLISGDDEARLLTKFIKDTDPDYEKKLTPQPRPNVLFEAGMAMGRSQERTVLVQVGTVKPWSDIAGRHITYLDNSPEKRGELVNKLKAAGCDVDTSGADWYKTGNFKSDITKNTSIAIPRKGDLGNGEKRLIKKRVNDLYDRVLESLNNEDATLERDYRIEYANLLQSAVIAWMLDIDTTVENQLLLLKAEAGTFDINQILSKDKLGSIKWVLNSVKKMRLIIESDN